MSEDKETETPDAPEREEKPKKEIGTKTMFELSAAMVDKAVGVVKDQSDESDKRVASAYEIGMDAVVQMAENQRKSNARMTLALVLVLGAVAMGAGADKLFGVFEIGESSSGESDVSEVTDPAPVTKGKKGKRKGKKKGSL